MPIGQHWVTCLHCGRGHLEGDCITNCCDICRMKGHHYGLSSGCPVCKGTEPEREPEDWERDIIKRIQSGEFGD